jgi:hypothetical protein
LSWGPIAELDPVRLSIKMEVWRVVFAIGVKAMLNGKLGREAARDRERFPVAWVRHHDRYEPAAAAGDKA